MSSSEESEATADRAISLETRRDAPYALVVPGGGRNRVAGVMRKPGRAGHREGPRRPLVGPAAVVVLVSLIALGLPVADSHGGATARLLAASSVVDSRWVNVTTGFSFDPNQLTVSPGALVELVVVQEATVSHTFVLSSLANVTIPANDTPAELFAFFNAHPPLVNLSIPATLGARVYANFTAPAAGTYEFVCEIPGHFQSGMYGMLVSTNSSPSSGSPSPFTTTVWVVIAVVVVVVGLGAGLAIARRRRPPVKPAT